jgi:hypothetical protein
VTTVAAVIVLRFFWGPILMGFVMLGVTDVAVVIGVVILAAIALRERMAGR